MTKIISIIALRRAILMKADPVVSFHANRMFMQKQTPVNVYMRSSSICVFEDRGKPEYPKKKKKKNKRNLSEQRRESTTHSPHMASTPGYEHGVPPCATLAPQGIFWYVSLFCDGTTEITDVIRNTALFFQALLSTTV